MVIDPKYRQAIPPQFCKKIEHRLIDCDMTQDSLAEKTGLSATTINRLIVGKNKDVMLSTLAAIADALNCNLVIDLQERKTEQTDSAS